MESMAERVTGQGQELVSIDHSLQPGLDPGSDHLETRTDCRAQRSRKQEQPIHCAVRWPVPATRRSLHEIRHAIAFDLATTSAKAVSAVLADALRSGAISAENLFSSDYYLSLEPGRKSTTRLLIICVTSCCPHPGTGRSVASVDCIRYFANHDGYVPTHNRRFAQPLTGDPARDLVGNRTKRIFVMTGRSPRRSAGTRHSSHRPGAGAPCRPVASPLPPRPAELPAPHRSAARRPARRSRNCATDRGRGGWPFQNFLRLNFLLHPYLIYIEKNISSN